MSETTARGKFRTKDLNQAAFIWCQPGTTLTKLEGGGGHGKTVFFLFDLPLDERDLAALVMQYANGQASVEPQAFCGKQSNLRDLLHGTKRDAKESSK